MQQRSISSKISTMLVFALLLYAFMPVLAFGAAAAQFKDIAGSYAQKEIQELVDAGIISGYEDNTFQPQSAMTRAELAKIIVLSMGLQESPEKASTFLDVDTKSWYRGYVGALVNSGITQGTSDTAFSPNAKVTREELVVFFVRAFGLEEAAKKLAPTTKLTDMSIVSDWAKAHVSLAFQMGFVQGIEGNDGTLRFSPKENAERQALARLAYEFKTEKSKYLDKAKELAGAVDKQSEQTPDTEDAAPKTDAGSNGGSSGTSSSQKQDTSQYFAVSSVRSLDNTTVQVTLDKMVINPVFVRTFSADGDLTVSKQEVKIGTSEVILTTSAQKAGQLYNLSYNGAVTDKTFEGTATTLTKVEAKEYVEDYQLVQEGTYGTENVAGIPDGAQPKTATFKGNLLIAGPGITLKNTTIEGDLIIGAAVGEGDVTLQNVEIKGATIVRGGGLNSIHLNDTIMVSIIVDKRSGAVRLVAQGNTVVSGEVTLQSSVSLQSPTTGNAVFGRINIASSMPSNSTVRLEGVFETVDVIATNIAISIPSGSVQNLTLRQEAFGTALDLGNSTVGYLDVQSMPSLISGFGIILNANYGLQNVPSEIVAVNTTGFEPTIVPPTGTPRLYFGNLTNGSLQLRFNQEVTNLTSEDFVVSATLNNQPFTLEQLIFNSAENTFAFTPLDAGQHHGKELMVNVEPAASTSKFERTTSAKVVITGFEGNIIDVNNNPVAGVTIQFRRGIGSTIGTILKTVVTDNNGHYQVTLPSGTYTGEITAPGFITTYLVGVAADNTYNRNENATAIRIPGENETRIVLVWGASPRDLDSHLVGPQPDGVGQFHTWYGGKTYYYNNTLFDDLDLDDVSSYGPETTTIRQDVYGTYRFYVHNFSGDSALSQSGAVVKVFRGSNPEPVRTYNLPAGNGSERYWATFEMTISPDGTTYQEIGQLVNTEAQARGDESLNTATLSSSVYNVNNANNLISNVPEGTPVADFKSKLSAPSRVTFNVYEIDGLTIKEGNVTNTDKVIVTAANGITKKRYSISTVGSSENIPATVTGLTYDSIKATGIQLKWNANTGNNTVGYAVYRNGSEVGRSIDASYTDTGLIAGTSYIYTVKAYDAANRYSQESAELRVTTPIQLIVKELRASADANVSANVYGPFVRENATQKFIVTGDVPSTDYLVVKFSNELGQNLNGLLTLNNGLTIDGFAGGTVQASVYQNVYVVFKFSAGLPSAGTELSLYLKGLQYTESNHIVDVEPVLLLVRREEEIQ
ncbi:S-layer homology domain-containing protein [Paenibacillus sp. 1_12]|uniref:S-layer homology domain-containing protein n=1 Tax=Paenibacillus sp. 1_12 TaxID=1566278 RepID=UPI0008EEEB1F|nr:S-layer homology domain-containing protein [Paenibacillus sp. 1_12]SFL07037.1 S-layer homology domain-containing protein [Paenibacillus sp. 1_12]